MECQTLNAWPILTVAAAVGIAIGYFWGRRSEFRRWCDPRRLKL